MFISHATSTTCQPGRYPISPSYHVSSPVAPSPLTRLANSSSPSSPSSGGRLRTIGVAPCIPGLTPYPTQALLCPTRTSRRPVSTAAAAGGSATPSNTTPLTPLLKFVSSQFLPVALTTALLIGCAQPQWGAAAAKTQLNSVITALIFILSGLNLKGGEAVKALQSPGSLAFGLISILGLTPLVGLVLLKLPLVPPSLALGLTVFACMPTALSSGIAMTTQVGGNTAMAILLTVSANVLAVFTMPYMLLYVLGSQAGGVNLDPQALFLQLVKLVLIPTFLGAFARKLIPGLATLVDSNKKAYGYLSAMCLAVVPWMQVSNAMMQNIQLPLSSMLSVVACALSVHIFFLIANTALVKLLNLGGEDRQEQMRIQQVLILLSSQKTLPVAVTVLTKLSAVLGPAVGLGAVAAVISHLCQTICDSFLVSWWVSKYGRLDEPPKTPKAA